MIDDRTKEQDREVARLSGLRRAVYYAHTSQGKDHATALRLASARCCSATVGHTATCENNPEVEW